MPQNDYLNILSTQGQVQGEKSLRRGDEVQNSDGAYVFAVDDFARLRRFLILGAEGGSYYASERQLTIKNCEAVLRAIREDGPRVVAEIVAVSQSGRAPKNDSALFCLALCFFVGVEERKALQESSKKVRELGKISGKVVDKLRKRILFDKLESDRQAATWHAAEKALPLVARTGTHLFQFFGYVKGLRGIGLPVRRAVANWYLNFGIQGFAESSLSEESVSDPSVESVRRLAYQVVKYPSRDGWSHRDLLRLCHPQASEQKLGSASSSRNALFHYAAKGWDSIGEEPHSVPELQIVWAAERIKKDLPENELLRLVRDYHLPMEAVPTAKRTPAVYETILNSKPGITWLIRNLGNLTKHGVLRDGQYDNLKVAVELLTNPDVLKKGRVHPISVLSAQRTYASGRGLKGHGEWTPVMRIVEALEAAFYLAFESVEPTGLRYVLGLDVSGSMINGQISGLPGVTPAEGTAALAMVLKRVEPWTAVMGFTSTFIDLGLTRTDTLGQAMHRVQRSNFGSTDCSLPMSWALRTKVEADVFVVITDNETNNLLTEKPGIALENYRRQTGIPARLAVVGMTSSGFTIADPKDKGQLDMVGFDSAAPKILSDFALGLI